ncbi:GDSL esterase/lipase At5g45670 [Striga asiatica]|uniref:GDSL esterase/lipase At5g45670 n=1 Tax=Striga asiatica TaxID=4170 RepID=A0A5A7P705_STRAF|nr:GDSL esterase/lipase At5g45670 [Striga asiatica]
MGVGLNILIVGCFVIGLAMAEPQVPCYFIFGDSLVDNGNNNGMQSLAKANYMPYGIDFSGGPTGRFSNGKTTVDVIAELLGFEGNIPPHATTSGQQILQGLNYASAAAGIRPETGRQLGGRIDFTGQVNNHMSTVEKISSMLGDKGSAANLLGKCIYSIIIGSNDYLNNYFMPAFYSTGSRYTPEEYAGDLIQRYAEQLRGQEQVPNCLFFMGDSLTDNGNNNNLITLAKANYLPNGIDFSGGPSGRFSNGRITPDFLAEFLGFDKSPPPFSTANGPQILKGVNYASGASGILDETAIIVGDRISLNRQLFNHGLTVSKIALLIGNATLAREHLKTCLYFVNMGSNDYLLNYLQPQVSLSSTFYTPQQFGEKLINQYSQQLRKLYNYGARKVVVFGLGMLGCTPGMLARSPNVNGSSCKYSNITKVVEPFNNRLKPLVDTLNNNLQEAQNEYTFWDNYHPSEVFTRAAVARAYEAASPNDAYPCDIRRLAQQ